jgi:hypothetical protein
MDDYHLNNIAKVQNQQKLGQIIILGKTKTWNFSEIWNIYFYNENNFVKDLMQTLLN